MSYVIALDQGTTSSRALLVDSEGCVRGVAQKPYPQHFPKPGWVEHNPFDILATQIEVLNQVMAENGLTAQDVDSIGITNQRETTMLWDRHTGEPVFNAIVWQCRRTASIVEALCADPTVAEYITRTTGLVPDAYFSASKIKWILDNVPGAREAAEMGDLLFGTVDTWLVWNLTGGAVHATDYTNASRTMLFDIHEGCWDEWLCKLFDVPMSVLPEVRPSSADYGVTSNKVPAADYGLDERKAMLPSMPAGIPICGVAGDQQAALFGQCCTSAGQAKNTYGTGCFLLMHTGDVAVTSRNNLVTTIAASAPDATGLEYALEGSVFMAGVLIQWLRDELGLIQTAAESEDLARSVSDSGGVYVVPAFTGLGAPYWDAGARGAIYGLTRGAGRAHIVRAALESLAYQVNDLVAGMEDDAGCRLSQLAVDGGASHNDFLMQFQSDILRTRLERPTSTETTALGAAYLAGLFSGYWESMDQIRATRQIERVFEPAMDACTRDAAVMGWRRCVARTRSDYAG
ncbi:MAG: glycerol kinase GlpK [Eggerthellaceae bacterium]|nr:glycerol kinase GlpK [Eggerthellaceae bacterium]